MFYMCSFIMVCSMNIMKSFIGTSVSVDNVGTMLLCWFPDLCWRQYLWWVCGEKCCTSKESNNWQPIWSVSRTRTTGKDIEGNIPSSFLKEWSLLRNKIIPVYCSMLHTVCWLICETCTFVLNAVGAACKNVSYNVDFKLNPRCYGKECDKWAENIL